MRSRSDESIMDRRSNREVKSLLREYASRIPDAQRAREEPSFRDFRPKPLVILGESGGSAD